VLVDKHSQHWQKSKTLKQRTS